MSKNGLFVGDTTRKVEPGEACVGEIQSRVNFSLFKNSSNEIPECVNLDL